MKPSLAKHVNRLNKSLFAASKIAALLACILFSSTLVIFAIPAESTVAQSMFMTENGLLKLSNVAYEVAFNQKTGSIAYIIDKSTGQKISEVASESSNNDSNLWIASLDHGDPVASSATDFKYTTASNKLTLTYTGKANVTVTVSTNNQALQFQAIVTNNTGANISEFSFPAGLQTRSADIQDGLLPMMPGALLNAGFFAKGSYVNQYPGVMFADYLALRSKAGNLALYSQRAKVLQPTYIGYEHVGTDSPYTKITHTFKTWIADKQKWSSPAVLLRVGKDYPETITAYRVDNGFDKFKSLRNKLGKASPAYFAAPIYKLDFGNIRQPFAQLKQLVIDKLDIPGMIHPVAFQSPSFDKGYPDFIPPNSKWGTADDFADLVKYIHSKNSIVVPYTNFSWWDNNGPTLLKLPEGLTLPDIVASGTDKAIIIEKYGPNVGVVMNLHNDFVKNKIDEQHKALLNHIGVDGIFEDQWGARNAPYDFTAAGLTAYDPSTSYFQGVLGHYHDHVNSNLMTEEGVDALAENGIAFMGTNYLWDMLGYRGATASMTSYYPMVAMMLRDKVLLYQHDLASETWTKNKDMLRWNLAQGYSLSQEFYDRGKGSLNMDNAWLDVVGVFQKYALANYTDELVKNYENLGNGITRTVFPSYQVYANWNKENSYTVNDKTPSAKTLPPGGVVTIANDGSVVAGIFTSYNGNALSEGEHYIVEVHTPDSIKIFQPLGMDTTIHIMIKGTAKQTVTAYRYDGTAISQVTPAILGNDLSFIYAATLNNEKVGYYAISRR